MKKNSILLFVAFWCSYAIAQNKSVDTSHVKTLLKIADSLLYVDRDSSLILIQKAKSTLENKDTKWYATALKVEGYRFNLLGNFKESNTKFDSAIVIYSLLKDSMEVLKLYNNIGINYMYLGNYAKAIELQFKCLNVAKHLKNLKMQAQSLNNISLNYQSLKDLENALMFAKEALAIKLVLNDSASTISSILNIASFYYDIKKHDSAYYYNQQAVLFAKNLNNTYKLFDAYLATGTIFFDKKNYDSALFYHKLSYSLMPDDVSVGEKMSVNIALMNDYLSSKNIQAFNKIYQKSQAILPEIEEPEVLYNYNNTLYDFYKQQGNSQLALKALEQKFFYKNILDSSSNNIEFQKAAIKYELNKKLVADSLQAEQKLLIANTKTTQTKNTLLAVALLLVIALAIAIALYNRSNLFKKKAIITEQEKLLAQQEINVQQLKTLQAQMNPHFVFNCFNTIDSFILQNKQYEASLLVQRFSKLSRKILEQTAQQYITLEEECSTLNTYLQIEQMRATHAFQFTINENAVLQQYLIPPMLLQPFVENALLHGIRPLQNATGIVEIDIEALDNDIRIRIKDNGIGRKKAAEQKAQNTNTHRSMAMSLTMQRLAAMHPDKKSESYITFTDAATTGTGTLITLIIPKITNNA